ncbi:uracil-DNA glycosylase [Thermodesulfobacteriota bacterium]
MEEGLLSPREELKEVLDQLKNLLNADDEMGLSPPTLSLEAARYLEDNKEQINSLESLRAFIGECERCKLWQGRTKLVFGEGSPDARLVFVGEGPGREEDLEGRPFVGEAGRLLTKIIQAMGLSREEVYICNVVKCRPPRNRDPERDEIETCIPFLKQQISLIRPDVICALGRIAASELTGKESRITAIRGRWSAFMGIPLMPTYHPAYLLRKPAAKREVWDDAKKIMKHLGLEVKKND